MIKIRITLENKADVIRELFINQEQSLEHLHKDIVRNFGLESFEMASFYITNSKLDLGQEIPLFDVSDSGVKVITMDRIEISSVLYSQDSQLIYVYDFLKMWRFYIEYIEMIDNEKAGCIKSIGNMPNEAPEIKFTQEFNSYNDNSEEYEEECI